MSVEKIQTWQMVQPGSKDDPGKIEKAEISYELGPGEVLAEVIGCGLCGTDLSYLRHGVPTRNGPPKGQPITLGHEIIARIVEGDSPLVGWTAIIPAVLPCNRCVMCKSGRENRCLAQKMPGNSLGAYGGFSSHIPVPMEDLCIVHDTGDFPVEHLAIVADAITTPFHAAMRANLRPGDNVMVVGGGGGVGTYMTQMAKVFGARVLICIDVVQKKLEKMLGHGADRIINPADLDNNIREVKKAFKALCKEMGVDHKFGWTIFEVSGSKAGQELALGLLPFASKLVVVGYSGKKVEYDISTIMGLESELIGSWGCKPIFYPRVLNMVLKGIIDIKPFVETRPMSSIIETFAEMHAGAVEKRVVFTPDF
jgi:6-hydroxycyclohex-1-ene-1-carbonyl-CoA dehydrogenase